MKAIILAAGEGTRLKPFTEGMPKVMLPVANKPILEYVINALLSNGIRDMVIVVGYKKEVVMNYFGNGEKWRANIEYAIQEKQLGTGHALLQSKGYAENNEILVLPGDNIIDKESICKLIESEQPSAIIEESEMSSKYGVVEIEKGIITHLAEKPEVTGSNLIATGIYRLNSTVFDVVKNCVREGKNDLTDALQILIEKEKIYGINRNGKWKDAVYPWNLLGMNAEVLQSLTAETSGKIERDVMINGNVVIGEDTIVNPGCYIKGPVIIGKGCEIGPHACIFPSTSIGDNVTVYPFTEVRNSIIMEDTTIGSHSIISNSIIGRGSYISPHLSTVVGDSVIEVEGEFHKIGGIGGFIGEDCRIGANVILDSGRIIGKNCSISSQKVINTDIPSRSKVV